MSVWKATKARRVYAALLKRERRALHLTVGTALRAASAPSDATLAYHFYQAEDWEKALRHARRAGEQAQAVFALREAATHFTQAIEAAHMLGSEPGMLLRLRGQAFEQMGQFDDALSDFERALRAARAAVDTPGEWQGLLDLGFLWASRDYIKAGALFTQALELTQALGDSRLVAQTLNRVGNWQSVTSNVSSCLHSWWCTSVCAVNICGGSHGRWSQ